jgi:NAD(P)-dependent dehydrogenase (short-subunit alcohol dehydrogenase family)
VLINNAGISGMTLPVADYPTDDWDKVVAVNLTAMFDVTRLAIPHRQAPSTRASKPSYERPPQNRAAFGK